MLYSIRACGDLRRLRSATVETERVISHESRLVHSQSVYEGISYSLLRCGGGLVRVSPCASHPPVVSSLIVLSASFGIHSS